MDRDRTRSIAMDRVASRWIANCWDSKTPDGSRSISMNPVGARRILLGHDGFRGVAMNREGSQRNATSRWISKNRDGSRRIATGVDGSRRIAAGVDGSRMILMGPMDFSGTRRSSTLLVVARWKAHRDSSKARDCARCTPMALDGTR